jgi:metallo-beta-lactamase class B
MRPNIGIARHGINFFFAAALIVYFSAPAAAQQDRILLSPLTGNIFVHTSFNLLKGQLFPANGLVVITDAGIVIIDTPWGEQPTQGLLDSLAKLYSKKVVLCISTHYHDDRTAGLDVMKRNGVATYMSMQSLELARKNNEKQSEFFFTKDTLFTVGSTEIETFYPGEGHTKDNIVVWLKKDKVLFGGCLVKSMDSDGLGNLADANLKEWPASIKKVIKKFPGPKYIVPGHFGWKGRGSLKHTLRLLKKGL